MGSRGPKPLPANVHRLRGTKPSKPASALGELQPDVEMPDCPKFLLKAAKAEWRRLEPHLVRYGLVSQLDRGALAMACQEWARWQWAEEQIAAKNAADTAGEAGLIETAPTSGYRMLSPYVSISRRSQQAYERLLQHFGLSPSARSRVTPSDAQPTLPGIEPKEGWGGL